MRYTSPVSKSPTSHPAKAPSHPGFILFLLASIAENKVFSSWLLGSFISGLIGLSGLTSSPLLEKAGIATFTAIQGAAVASAMQEKRIAAVQGKAQLNRSQFAKECDRLEADKADLLSRNRELDKKDAKLTAVEASLKTRADTYQDRILTQVTRDCEAKAAKTVAEARKVCQDNIAAKQAELDKALADKLAIQQEYGQMAQTTKNTAVKVVSDVNQKYKALGDKAAEVIATGNDVLSSERHDVNKVLTRLGNEIKAITAELAEHKQLVAKLQAPKLFTQSCLEAQTGNRIQRFLASRNVILSCFDFDTIKFGKADITLEPINCDFESVKDQLEPLFLHLGVEECPTARIENERIVINVRLSSERKPKGSVIKRVSASKLKQSFIDITFGLRVTGYTGRGKSTLLNNLINLYEQDMGQPFTIFDPKVDFPSADYPKNKVYRGPKRCAENIDLIGTICEARQEYRVLNDEQGVAIPATHQVPRLFLIDECKDIHDSAALADMDLPAKERHYGKDFKFSIQKGLEVGRGLKVRVVYSTVTPDSSDFGFKNSVFKQSATVFLGDQCYEALGTKSQYLTTVSDEQKARLRQEYDARVASADPRDKFIGLFFNGLSNEVFLFSPPLPDTWKSAENDETEKAGFEGVAPSEAFSAKVPQTQAQKSAQPSAKSAPCQNSAVTAPNRAASAQKCAAEILSSEALIKSGAECPECHAHSVSFRSKRVRKGDSSMQLRCKTELCASGGEFRVTVSDYLK